MIPLWLLSRVPFLGKVPWKLVGYGLAVLLVAIFVWRVNVWHSGYLARKEAVAALATEKAAHEADMLKVAQEREQSEKDRAKLAMDLDAIRVRFADLQKQSPRVTIRTVEVPIAPGQTTCPVPRVSTDFVRVWNSAGTP